MISPNHRYLPLGVPLNELSAGGAAAAATRDFSALYVGIPLELHDRLPTRSCSVEIEPAAPGSLVNLNIQVTRRDLQPIVLVTPRRLELGLNEVLGPVESLEFAATEEMGFFVLPKNIRRTPEKRVMLALYMRGFMLGALASQGVRMARKP